MVYGLQIYSPTTVKMKAMMISNDYPEVFSVDSKNSTDLAEWWDTLGTEWVRVNLITDTLGNTTGSSGSSQDLTGGADRQVLAALRDVADVVVLGGATVRAEPNCVPRHKDVVIISKSGNVPLDAIKRARGRVTVLHAKNVEAPRATTGVVLRQFTGESILKTIRGLGYAKILCEGGITIASKLVDANAVDEWCLTVSPKLGTRTATHVAPDVGGTLTNIAHDVDGFRYTRRTPDGAPRKTT